MCQLFESIQILNGVALHTTYHQQRANKSTAPQVINIEQYIHSLTLPIDGCHKLRITYSRAGIDSHTLTPYIPRDVNSFRLITDDHILYPRKYNDRSAIDHLWAQRQGCDDIIIIRQGYITDSSFANIALFDGTQWVTPATPLLEGTCRARLINEGSIITRHITPASLPLYTHITLINSMLQFQPTNAIYITPQSIRI